MHGHMNVKHVEASSYFFRGCRNFCLPLSENKLVEMPNYQHQHIAESRTEFFLTPYFSHLCITSFFHSKIRQLQGVTRKVKGKGLPRQAEVAQGVPGWLRPRIILTFRHYKSGRSSAKRTGRLYPRRNLWYSLSEAESTSEHMVLSGVIIIVGIQPWGRFVQRPELSQSTGIALVR